MLNRWVPEREKRFAFETCRQTFLMAALIKSTQSAFLKKSFRPGAPLIEKAALMLVKPLQRRTATPRTPHIFSGNLLGVVEIKFD